MTGPQPAGKPAGCGFFGVGRRSACDCRRPHLPPVRKVEQSSAHVGRRLTAAVLLLEVGVVALVYGIASLFAAERAAACFG